MIYNVGSGGSGVAEAIQYDNTDSGLTADNVQDAIDELDGNVDNINVYVGTDKKLHFVDSAGADTVLPFSGSSLNKIVLTPNGNTILNCSLYHDNDLIFLCPYYPYTYGLNQTNAYYNILCSETYANNYHITLKKAGKVNGVARASGYAFNITRTSTSAVTLTFDS